MQGDTRSLSEEIAPAGLYIHIPFCIRKCLYCDFYSVSAGSIPEEYIQAIIRHIAEADFPPLLFDSIYFGGGTPSLLNPDAIHRILDAAAAKYSFSEDTEITIEANPGTISIDKLKQYKTTGIDRISIGVQSFQPEHLRFLGRIHTGEHALESVRFAQKAGFHKINLDLIFGLPGQSPEDWKKDLKKAMNLRIDHLSCYLLTYEPDVPLGKKLAAGEFKPLPQNRMQNLFEITGEFLKQGGYQRYEISNFSKNGSGRSRHNCKYWTGASYFGIGPSAHSYHYPQRWWHTSDLDNYMDDLKKGTLPAAEMETLTFEQQVIESIYLGLRIREGIDINSFDKRFGFSFSDVFFQSLTSLSEEGLLKWDDNKCRLTDKGYAFHESICGKLISDDFPDR